MLHSLLLPLAYVFPFPFGDPKLKTWFTSKKITFNHMAYQPNVENPRRISHQVEVHHDFLVTDSKTYDLCGTSKKIIKHKAYKQRDTV